MNSIRQCFRLAGCRLFLSLGFGAVLGAIVLLCVLQWRPFSYFRGGSVSQLMDELTMKDKFMTSAVHEYPSISVERLEGKLHWVISFMDRQEGKTRQEALDFLRRYRAVTQINELQQMVVLVAHPRVAFEDIEEVLLCVRESGLRYVWLNGRGILQLADSLDTVSSPSGQITHPTDDNSE